MKDFFKDKSKGEVLKGLEKLDIQFKIPKTILINVYDWKKSKAKIFKLIKKTHHLNRLITLSPLTEMARKFHLSNGAVQIQVNETTQNFEYEKV